LNIFHFLVSEKGGKLLNPAGWCTKLRAFTPQSLSMKKGQPSGIYLCLFLFLAVAAGFSGCAGTQTKNKESLLSEAGFRTRTPSTPRQLEMYNRMTPNKLERNTFRGRTLYTYADKQRGIVYIGGEKAYQRYRQLGIKQASAENELEASYSEMLSREDQVWSVNYD
jgi:hypothetical protein